MRRKLTVSTLAAISATALVLGVNSAASSSFDSQKWRSEAGNLTSSNSRHGMSLDLEKNVLRIGMTKDEVVSILGQPDGKKKTGAFIYDLGVGMIDLDFYVLEFDEAGKLKRFYFEPG
ncbi:hypothetical protein [Rhodomicrobium udaipurense]|uniref:Lipoprotein SmpA/OmlA domain-containing protein n=1 Tax=Rhodomicrobium udaipurense TaxID=1202716 RepID=A0A8I1GCB4_9HYPH|nr:hypothetical protein [Rhodomicrobium udaipurense]MBJ7544458.1 hypothetical protein [Rhodomicrobium udaipurense]